MLKLVCTFVVRIPPKTGFLTLRPICGSPCNKDGSVRIFYALTIGAVTGLEYIGTCPASQNLLAYKGKNVIFTRNIKIFTCPAAWGTCKYERTSAIFEPCVKQKNNQRKSVIMFLSISWNMYFRCSKEPSHWDGSSEYPKHMFWLRNKKIIFSYTLLSGTWH